MQIRLKEVEFSYGNNGFRLGIPDWKLDSGQKAAFLGPSGSGKTTLIRMLAGLVDTLQGKILFDGQNWEQHAHEVAHKSIGT